MIGKPKEGAAFPAKPAIPWRRNQNKALANRLNDDSSSIRHPRSLDAVDPASSQRSPRRSKDGSCKDCSEALQDLEDNLRTDIADQRRQLFQEELDEMEARTKKKRKQHEQKKKKAAMELIE